LVSNGSKRKEKGMTRRSRRMTIKTILVNIEFGSVEGMAGNKTGRAVKNKISTKQQILLNLGRMTLKKSKC
jgi:hypothetical protein